MAACSGTHLLSTEFWETDLGNLIFWLPYVIEELLSQNNYQCLK
jgi:hypothetical protein